MKKKRMFIGSIFAAFLLLSVSFISAAQVQQKNEASYTTTSGVLTTLDQLIDTLQYIHDFIVENYPEEFDQEFLAEFQENINTISDTGAPGFCLALLGTLASIAAIALLFLNNPVILSLLNVCASFVVVLGIIFCSWDPYYLFSASGASSSCGCTQ